MEDEEEKVLEINQFEGLIDGLMKNKFGCCDNFFKPSTVLGLRENIHSLSHSEEMRFAGLGKSGEYQQNSLIRGDKISWIEKSSVNEHETVFLKKISNFIQHLNSTCFTSLIDFESHYANYERNSFYKRHLDQFKNDKGRKFSMILYLNDNWQAEDGGAISLYPEGEQQKDIAPEGGRLVFFRSDELEHEVHPSFTRNRMSIAAWFKS